jgi:hypothetical protein
MKANKQAMGALFSARGVGCTFTTIKATITYPLEMGFKKEK